LDGTADESSDEIIGGRDSRFVLLKIPTEGNGDEDVTQYRCAEPRNDETLELDKLKEGGNDRNSDSDANSAN
jgi:hypothetical protein